MDWLTSDASFTLAALIVTWAGIVLIAFLATSLHIRVQRLERAGAATPDQAPFRGIVGQSVANLVPDGLDPEVRVLLFLSRSCGSCAKLIDELSGGSWAVPTGVLWTDGPAARPALGAPLRVLEAGSALSRALGIRVTPFLLVLDGTAQIVAAAPVNTARAMQELVARTVPAQPAVPVP